MIRYLLQAAMRRILHLSPFVKGGVRISHSELANHLARGVGLEVASLGCRLRLLVDVDDYCGRALYFTGDYEKRITWICKRLLRRGDCFLDVGSNYGEVGMYAARFVGPSGCVHMFEPQKRMANLSRISAELNGFSHVTVHEVALSDDDGEQSLLIPRDHNSGRATLDATLEEKEEVVRTRVFVRHSGRYLRQLALPRVRVVKIDVEGHEKNVISGALEYFRSSKPVAILFELHPNGIMFFDREVIQLLSDLGYEFYQIDVSSLLKVKLKRIRTNESLANGYDFVAISADKDGEEARRKLCL